MRPSPGTCAACTRFARALTPHPTPSFHTPVLQVQGQSARSAIRLPDIQAPAKYRCFSMSATEWTLMQWKVTRKEEKARAKKAQVRNQLSAGPGRSPTRHANHIHTHGH